MTQLCNAMLMAGGVPASPWATWNGSLDGSAAIFRATLPVGCSVCALSSTLVIAVWEDAGVLDLGYVVAGSISGATITWGTAIPFSGVSTVAIPQVTALDATHAVISYVDTGDSSKVKAIALSVSTLTITLGGVIVTVDASANTDAVSVTTLSSSKALVVWNNATSKGRAMVLDVSGTTITTNTGYQFNSTAQVTDCVVSAISATQALVVYADVGNSSYGTAQVLDISSSTVTGNTEYVFKSSVSTVFRIAAISSSKFSIVYRNAGDSNYITTQVLTVAGTVVSNGSSVRVVNYADSAGYAAISPADSQSAFIFYQTVTTNKGTGVVSTIPGSTSTMGTPVNVQNSVTSEVAVCQLDSTHVLYVYRDEADDKGKGKVSRCI